MQVWSLVHRISVFVRPYGTANDPSVQKLIVRAPLSRIADIHGHHNILRAARIPLLLGILTA